MIVLTFSYLGFLDPADITIRLYQIRDVKKMLGAPVFDLEKSGRF